MAKQTINIGTSANDGTGSTLRAAFDICNDNFTELYDGTGGLLHKIEGANFTGSLLIGHATTGTLSSAQNNTGIGIGALDALTTGDNNIAIGQNAGTLINSGTENVFIGQASGDALTTGNYNVAVGHETLSNEDTHGGNTAIGHLALRSLNAGVDAYNIAVGYLAGLSLTTGKENVIIGAVAGDALTTGVRNVAIGHAALSAEDEHGGNVAIGYQSLLVQDAGNNAFNVAVGFDAGKSISTGISNTIIGGLAGDNLTTGSNNIVMGYNATASAVGVSNEVTIGDNNISTVRIPSDSTLKIGVDGDLQLEHVSSNSFIKNTAAGDLYIENQVDDKDVIFRCDDGSGGLATYFYLDGSGVLTRVSRNFRVSDSIKLQAGSSGDFSIFHNGTDSYLENDTGDLYIRNKVDDKDIVFQSDDGSGGVATYFKLDGSGTTTVFHKDIRFDDSVLAKFGADSDLQISHNGSNTLITNNTGNILFTQNADDKDISFYADNGSGGTAEYFKLDGSEILINVSAANGMQFNDNVRIKVGSGSGGDLRIYHDSSNSYVQSSGTGDLIIEQRNDDQDIVFNCDDGSGGVATYFRLDGSAAGGGYTYTVFPDQSAVSFGNSFDLNIFHLTDSYISNDTGDLIIRNNADDSDIVFKTDDGSGGVETYFYLDGSAGKNISNKNFRIIDSKILSLGSSDDLQFFHNGTDSFIDNYTGNLTLRNRQDDGDILFVSDNGSGGLATYFFLDGSATQTTFQLDTRHNDSVKAKFGNSNDLQIYHTGTKSLIVNTNGDLEIQNQATDKDIIFKSDDGSGGLATYFFLDGSNSHTNFQLNARWVDSAEAQFGNSGDFIIKHTGDTYLSNTSGNMYLRQQTTDGDMIFQCDDGSGGDATYLSLDGSDGFSKAHKKIRFLDNVVASFGNNDDLNISHNGTDSQITNTSGHLQFTNTADDKDITFATDNGSGGDTIYMTIDGGNEVTSFQKHTKHEDSVVAYFGNGSDLQIKHNATDSVITNGTGDLFIENTANDKDIYFKSDNGSGGTTDYIQLDGSEVSTKILTQKVIMSNLPTSDPSNAGQLYTDSGVLKVSAG